MGMRKYGKQIALIALLAALALALCACGADYCYDHAERYTAGDAAVSEPVRSLEIDWIDGSVTVLYGEGAEVILAETSENQLEQRDLLRWWLDGDTLRVRYAEDGHHTDDQLNKHLTVTLPRDTVPADLSVTTRSASVQVEGITMEKGHWTTASGRVTAAFDAEEAEITTASGGVRLTVGHAGKVDVTTASGSVSVDAGAFDALDVNTASGAITLAVKQTGFTAEITSASGKLTDHLGMRTQDEQYVYGDGGASVGLHTASGHITVEGQ